MNANVNYGEGGEPTSFVVKGDRTRWHWSVSDGVATFRRVEVRKDDHSTETHVVLFGGEWVTVMEFVENLSFVEEIEIEDPIEDR